MTSKDFVKVFDIREEGASLLTGFFKSTFIEENAYNCLFSSQIYRKKAAAHAGIKMHYEHELKWDITFHAEEVKRLELINVPMKVLDRMKFYETTIENANVVFYTHAVGEGCCHGELIVFPGWGEGKKQPMRCDSPAKAVVVPGGIEVVGLEKEVRK